MAASQPVRIEPSSKWVLDYASDSCRLIRRFGEGRTETKLIFEAVAPDQMTMLLVGCTLRSTLGDADVKARFLPGTDEAFTGTAAEAEHGTKGAAFWTLTPLTPDWKSDAEKLLDRKRHKGSSTRPDIDLVARAAAMSNTKTL